MIIAWTFDDCGSNLTEYTGLEQHAGCNRRVQEVVRVKQKKKLKLNRSPTVWTTGVHSAAFDWVSMVFCGVPLRASVLSCVLTSDRCLGARVFLRSRRWFFFRCWPPVVFFLIEKAAAFFFEFRFVAIIKNRPVRGGFLLQLNLCGPNSTLCRWYRTFFEILFQKCVVLDLFEILRRVPAW